MLGLPQLLMGFTGAGWSEMAPAVCLGPLPCALSSCRKPAGLLYMVVAGQRSKRVRVEVHQLSSRL